MLGLQLTLSSSFSSALAVVVASGFIAAIMICLDRLIIERYIGTIGNSVGIYSMWIHVLPKTGINLWSEALTPKVFGLRSGRGHAMAAWALFSLVLMYALAMMLYPTAICISASWRTINDPNASVVETFLTGLAMILLLIGWMVAVCFVIPFKFYAADFREEDGRPSPEFLQRMQDEAKLAESKNSF